jgi:saccharopine dehydrogenase (NAD+, L-lysine forming)
MSKIRIGIIKEGKVPIDKRVPFTPEQAVQLRDTFGVEVIVQKSKVRTYADEEYAALGLPTVDSVADCDILFGVKEVPIAELIPNKTYFFFSHTIKEQAYNRALLKHILASNIRLIDYECLTDTASGQRIVAFGRYAGIVGAYNGIWAFGKRYRLFDLRRAQDCFDYNDLKNEYAKVKLPPIKIALTGGGRVAKGAMEVLCGMNIRKVSPAEFLENTYHEPVFAQLNTRDYNKHKEGDAFSRDEFYEFPERYTSNFLPYAYQADMLIACAYWDPAAPVLFTKEEIVDPHFKIRVIADVTCDIEGSIPSTKRPSTIDAPLYDYNPSEDREEAPLSEEGNITVMAVDNLPCELPRDASTDFGRELLDNVMPHLLQKIDESVIERATIAENGLLGKHYQYLKRYAEE